MKNKFKVLGFVGKRGCGKDACTKYIAENYKAKEIIMSDFISRALRLFYIPQNRKNIPWFITRIRDRFGKGVLARAVIHEIGEDGYAYYLLNGIRLRREVEILRETFGKRFVLVDIVCNDAIRFKRIKNREKKTKQGKDEVDLSLEDFVKQERRIVTEKEIPYIEKQADYAIENNGSKKELHKKLNGLVKKIK